MNNALDPKVYYLNKLGLLCSIFLFGLVHISMHFAWDNDPFDWLTTASSDKSTKIRQALRQENDLEGSKLIDISFDHTHLIQSRRLL